MFESRRLAAVSFRVVASDSQGALAAMGSYFDELDRRFPTGFEVGDALGVELDTMRPPTGGFVVIDDDGSVAGCGGVLRFDDQTAEIKRMWVAETLRGLGLGAQLLARLEALARELGYSAVVLDTNSTLTQAISMYESSGYLPVERYNDNPYAQRWFRKEMG